MSAEAFFQWRVFLLLPGRAATVLASRRGSDLSLQGFDRDRVSGQQPVVEPPIIGSADLQIPRMSASSRSDKTLPGRILPSTNLHLLKQFLYRLWLSNPESTHPGSPRHPQNRTCIRITSIRGLVGSCVDDPGRVSANSRERATLDTVRLGGLRLSTPGERIRKRAEELDEREKKGQVPGGISTKPETGGKVQFGVWGLICGAVITIIIGFAWGGWTTRGTSQQTTEAAVLATRAAICVAQFIKDPNYKEKLKEFKAVDSWGRSTFIEKGGWDKMPGEEKASSTVSRACAEGLEFLTK